jgi:very-short-patch-repair endonuclease
VIRASGLPEPTRQYEVHVDGRRYFLDFAHPERMLAIEIDGWSSRSRRDVFVTDRTRQNDLVLAGWRFLRFTKETVEDEPARMLGALRAALAAAA